jgi:hypothetical protein
MEQEELAGRPENRSRQKLLVNKQPGIFTARTV